MTYLIMIIDDEHKKRKVHYKNFERIISEKSGFKVSFDFIDDPSKIISLDKNRYSAAIVDAVLDSQWKKYNITMALHDIGRNIPVAIISERWDNTNSLQIDEAWKLPNCRTFLHWRDIDPNRNGEMEYAYRAFVSMIADHKNLDTQMLLEANNSIRILHLSDVQTGGFDKSRIKLEANRCADRILEHCNDSPPNFVAFTGDVTEYGSSSQYDDACEWITYFFSRLNLGSLPSRKLLYVPGNHDVNLCLAAASRIKLHIENDECIFKISDEIHHEELLNYAYSPYRNFLAKISDCPLLTQDTNMHNFAWVEARYRHLGVVFYGINTAQPVNAFGLPNREVNSDALALIRDNLKQSIADCGDRLPLVVGLGHHCPTSASDDSAVSNPNDFKEFFLGMPKTALFLHGHTHQHQLEYLSSGGFRIVRSCATTLTKPSSARPSDSPRGFNLLELHREDGIIIKLCATSFVWINNDFYKIQNDSWDRGSDGMFKEKNTSVTLRSPMRGSQKINKSDPFHVFLSHNSQDKPIVRKLAQALKLYDLQVWLDEEQLVPGRPWQEALETIIQTTQAAAVLIGGSGLGPWEEPEMRALLTEFVERKLPVIPVLLPGTPGEPKLPLFLRSFTWVDLRDGLTDLGLEKLVWGITGDKVANRIVSD